MEILDWMFLGLYFLLLAGILVWVATRKDKTSTDYFLAGRDAT